jgi:putative DNA primase/helicase
MSAGNMREAALRLAARGLPVLPLHTPDDKAPVGQTADGTPSGGCSCWKPECTNTGKHPRTPNGLQGATTDPEIIRKWWTRWPRANIGIRTGEALPGGGYLAVLDIDPRNDGDAQIEELEAEHGALPDTVTVSTGGGGWHYYMKSEEPVSGRKIGKGIDLKGLGGYVIAPPSLHASGRRYGWR